MKTVREMCQAGIVFIGFCSELINIMQNSTFVGKNVWNKKIIQLTAEKVS